MYVVEEEDGRCEFGCGYDYDYWYRRVVVDVDHVDHSIIDDEVSCE
jgi:hypothetical protein